MSEVLSSTPSIKLQGMVHPDSYFQIVEKNEIDWQLWLDVLQGKVAGAIFRGVVNQEIRQQICDNFWRSITLKQQTDGLPSYYEAFIGSSVTKPLDVYFNEVEQVRPDIQGLFDNTVDFFGFLLNGVEQLLAKQGCVLRVAQHNGRKAGEYKMKSWGRNSGKNSGTFVLDPHDDEGTLRSPHLQGFEIGQLVNGRTVGVNICLENLAGGGDLHYWNISPNDEIRQTLSLTDDNVGYPLESLANFDKIVLPIRSGDIYLFDSTKIHAVGQLTNETAQRLTLLWFMGFVEPKTVIYWA